MLAGILFGLAPMRIALSAGPALALKTSAATSNSNASKSRFGRSVVAIQMTLCVVLLVGAGLLIRTLRNLEHTSLGMQVDGLVVFGVKPNVPSVAKGVLFYRETDAKAWWPAGRGVGDHYGGAHRVMVVG